MIPYDATHAGPAVRWGELTDVFETEGRLLDELLRILLSQREGLSGNDVQLLDESVYSAQRVLLTLQEARLRRRTLMRIVGTGDDLKLTELEDVVSDMPPHVLESRDRLLRKAAQLRRELGINRNAIQGAIHLGDQIIRSFAGAASERPLYAPPREDESPGTPGVLLDRQG